MYQLYYARMDTLRSRTAAKAAVFLSPLRHGWSRALQRWHGLAS